MFIFGILSLLQILFIPGLLIHKKITLKGSFIQNLSVVIALSMLSNYLGVLLLTLLHLYLRVVVLGIFLIEIALLLYLYRDTLRRPLGESITQAIDLLTQQGNALVQYLGEPRDEKEKLYRFFYSLFFLASAFLAFVGLWWALKLFFYNIGTVFSQWDAVVSWNKWAVIWSQQETLYGVSAYPQMMPTNWSLTYIFMGNTEVQFFAKSITPLFTLLIFLMLLDLSLDKKEAGYLLGVLLTYLLFKKLIGMWMTAGYSDIPLAYFTFLSIYWLHKHAENTNTLGEKQTIFLGMSFAAAAAVTKQAGIYLVVVYPVLLYLLLLRPRYGYDFRKVIQILWQPILLAFIIVAPWYLYRQFVFISGTDIPELPHILNVTESAHQTAVIQEKILSALAQLGKYRLLLFALLPFLFILNPVNRWVALLIALPFTLIWAFVASYDARNLSLAIPLIAMTSGAGFSWLVQKGLRLLLRGNLHRLKTLIIPILFAIFLIWGNSHWSNEILQAKQTEEQMQLFSPEKNQMLIEYIAQNPDAVNKILTFYPLDYIPGLAAYKIHDKFDTFAIFEAKIQNQAVTHILIPKAAEPDIEAYVEQKIQTGEYELIFENSQWVSYRFIRIR